MDFHNCNNYGYSLIFKPIPFSLSRCNRVASSDAISLYEVFSRSPRARDFLVQEYTSEISMSNISFHVQRKFGDQSASERSIDAGDGT
jgi:hypothetical protein